MSGGAGAFKPKAVILALLALVALVVLVLLTAGGSPPGATAKAPSRSGAMKLVRGTQALQGVYAGGLRVRVRGREARAAANAPADALAAPTPHRVVAPLLGYEAAVAVPSPDGAAVAYNTWRMTRPVDWQSSPSSQGLAPGDPIAVPELYVRDLATGRDVSLGSGTMSVAYRSDGALAYARGGEAVRFNEDYLRDVVVRDTPASAPVAWTSAPGRYSPVAWAGDRLIAHRDLPDVEAHDVVAFDGPGHVRTLAEQAEVVAISPSGARVVVSTGEATTGRTSSLLLVDVASGDTVADVNIRATFDPATGAGIVFADDPGDWEGDELVLRTESGLLILHATEYTLSVRQVLHLDLGGIPLNEPRFASDDRRIVEAWANLPESRRASARYQCDRATLTCVQGEPAPVMRFARPAYDLSRGRGGNR
jgi:hypothetical protein